MGGGPPPHAMGGPPPNPAAVAAHTELQRVLLTMLATSGCVSPPVRIEALLLQALERFHDGVRAEAQQMLNPGNVERALLELQGHVPGTLHLERGELVHANVDAIADFHCRLTGAPRAPPLPVAGAPASAEGAGGEGERKAGSTRKRTATAAQDDELAEILDLVGQKSVREQVGRRACACSPTGA